MRPNDIITHVPGVEAPEGGWPPSSVQRSSSFAGLAGIRHGANVFQPGAPE